MLFCLRAPGEDCAMHVWNTSLIGVLVVLVLIAWGLPFVLGPIVLLKAAPTPYGLPYVALVESEDVGLPAAVRSYVADSQRTLIERGFTLRLRARNTQAR